VGVLYQFYVGFMTNTKNGISTFMFKFLPFIFALAQLALVLTEFGILNIK
jgi:hypothetical protein